jgi:hypothetical protein
MVEPDDSLIEAMSRLCMARAHLEGKLLAAIEEFQTRTGLGVESVNLEHFHRVGVANRAACRVTVEVKI